MPTYLFFDTETTGLPKGDGNARYNQGVWPDLVSIAWILTTDEGVVLSSEYHIIYPEAWVIPEDSIAIHKISQAMALRYGSLLDEALHRFLRDVDAADVLIAHNIRFDQNVIDNALKWRLYHDQLLGDKGKRLFCSMRHAKNLVGLPGKTPGTFKQPKLVEMYRQLFGAEPTEILHNAMGDTQVLMKCFFRLWGKDLPAEPVKVVENEAGNLPIVTKLVLSLDDTTQTV